VAAPQFNGSSGAVLQERYLTPLGLTVGDCWITDLHDRYFLSPGNDKAVARYEKLRATVRCGATAAMLPRRPAVVVPTAERLARLRAEFQESGAPLVITLGNESLGALLGPKAHKLSQDGYGVPDVCEVFGRKVKVLRLCHPRQAGAPGESSPGWGDAHASWMKRSRGRAVV
jgi:hypothetical protein